MMRSIHRRHAHEITITLLTASLSSACVVDPESLGHDMDSETGGEPEDVEPIECAPPCALMDVVASSYLHWEIWAVSLDEPAQTFVPERLFTDGSNGGRVLGPTPWGSIAVFHYLPEDDLDFGWTDQVRLDDEQVLTVSPFLPPELPGAPISMQFDEAGTVVVMEVPPTLFTGYELWAARLEAGVGTDLARVSPPDDDESSVMDANVFADGSGVVFLRDTGIWDSDLYYTQLSPDFGAPMLMSAEHVEDVALVGEQIVAIIAPQGGERTIQAWPQAQPIGAPTMLGDELADLHVIHRGNRLVYTRDSDRIAVDVDTGETASLELEEQVVHEIRWLREGVLIASLGDSGALSMLTLDGVQPSLSTPVTGEFELGTTLDEFECDDAGHYCIHTTVSESARQVSLVDVSGETVGTSTLLLEGIDPSAAPTIEFFRDTHATILFDDTQAHVVDLAVPSVTTLEPPLASDDAIDHVVLHPNIDSLLFYAWNSKAGTSTMWRASLDGSGFTPMVPDRVWGDSEGWSFSHADLFE